jgi:hypothetical protein
MRLHDTAVAALLRTMCCSPLHARTAFLSTVSLYPALHFIIIMLPNQAIPSSPLVTSLVTLYTLPVTSLLTLEALPVMPRGSIADAGWLSHQLKHHPLFPSEVVEPQKYTDLP